MKTWYNYIELIKTVSKIESTSLPFHQSWITSLFFFFQELLKFIFHCFLDAACKVPPELQGKDWVYEYTDVSTGETMTKTLSFGSTTIQQGISLDVQGSNINAWTCLSDLTISDTESVAVFKWVLMRICVVGSSFLYL